MATIALLLLLSSLISASLGQFITFAQSSYSVNFQEEQPVGAVVTSITATALDASFVGTPGSFALLAGGDNRYFALEDRGFNFNDDTSSTNVLSTFVFDWDDLAAQRQFSFSVSFTANGMSESAPVTVVIEDINDNSPSFRQDVFDVEISEALQAGEVVVDVFATDPDEVVLQETITDVDPNVQDTMSQYTVVNGLVTHTIIAGNALGHFALNPVTGILTVASGVRLNVNQIAFYNLTILAEDGGGRRDEAAVLVTVLDSNTNAPQIIFPRGVDITISEDTPTGFVILEGINATDEDAGLNAAIQFLILDGDVLNSFTIVQDTGRIVVSDRLDREVQRVLNITVAARDRGLPQPRQSIIYVVVRLQDVNDYIPRFTQTSYTFEVSENARLNAIVGRTEAEDLDEGDNAMVTYSIQDGGSGEFSIEFLSGELILTTSLNREVLSSYLLVVEAVDNPSNSSFQLSSAVNVTIVVGDANDNSPIFDRTVYMADIFDNVTTQEVIVQVRASDADSGTNAAISYIFSERDPIYPEAFTIDETSGVVLRNRPISYQNQTRFSYTVRASDSGGFPLFNTVQVMITLHDVNENPPFFTAPFYNSTISEGVGIGAAILNVTAEDRDSGPNGDVRYRILGEFDSAGSFEVNEMTGELRVRTTLDFDVKSEIIFVVEAFDGGFRQPLVDRVNVTFTLTGMNDEAPIIQFPSGFQLLVPENTPPEVEVVRLRNFTTDPDVDHTGDFSFMLSNIYDDFSTNASFYINETTGLLRSLREFDREEQPRGIVVTVTTIDFEGLTRDMNLTVMIDDMNDNPPIFETSVEDTVHEFLPVGTEVVSSYQAVDSDIGSNAELRYMIHSGRGREMFTVDPITGGLYTAAILNKTVKDTYNLTVMVTDLGNPPMVGFGSFLVEVLDSNDMVPVFSQSTYVSSLPESSPVGSPLLVVNATDGDIGTNAVLGYFLNASDSTSERFTLDEITGELFTDDSFDREVESEIELVVMAVDGGLVPFSLTGLATVRISILDVNDHTPIFDNSSYEATVIENAPINTSIAVVRAFDSDATFPNNAVMYSLQGERSNVLRIDPVLGVVYVDGEIDWEEGEDFVVTVVASDGSNESRLNDSVELSISIVNINDNAPVFEAATLTLNISENAVLIENGTFVGYVMAVDFDCPGNNPMVTYSVLMDFAGGMFTLDSYSGEVELVRGTLDREIRESYALRIRVTDNGNPFQLHSDDTLTILIDDANDHAPVFDRSTYIESVEERRAVGMPVLTIFAMDSDNGTNADIRYAIISETATTAFVVDEVLGTVSVNQPLDFETQIRHAFDVVAFNPGDPNLNDTARVEITVTDSNDHHPMFDQLQYSAVIRENLASGTTLLRVSAQDNDTNSENKNVFFSLLNSAGSENFGIHNETGVLYTNAVLNREQYPTYNLTIIANNSLSPHPLNTSVQFFVSVTDLNDMHPSFPLVINVTMPENATVGSVIHTLSAVDGDEGLDGTIEYSLLQISDIFSLNSSSGEITLLQRLDEEGRRRFFLLPVVAMDFGDPRLSNYTNVFIRVLDSNNHRPVFSAAEYTISLHPLLARSTTFLRLEVTDLDEGSNAEITTSIVSGNGLGLFDISASGEVSTAAALGSHSGRSFTLRVEATDGVFVSPVNVTVRIQVGNPTLPRFDSPTYTATTLSETALVGYTVIELSTNTQDADFFHVDSDVFDISNVGVLSLAGSVDFETQSVHQVSVSVSNMVGDAAYAVVTVNVQDYNEHGPEFISDNFFVAIPETTPTRDVFFTARTTDQDGTAVNSFVEYDILLTDMLTRSHFTIDGTSGGIRLTGPLNFEMGDRRFNVTIRATNTQTSPIFSSTAPLEVVVLNGNSFSPQFEQQIYPVMLQEGTLAGLNIVNVTATDGDNGTYGDLTYGLHGDHRYLDFRIDTFTGAIFTNIELDFEQSQSYTLDVYAYDSGDPSRSGLATVRVVVEDLNDNIPIWEQQVYSATLAENSLVGTLVVQVLATDGDLIVRSTDLDGNTVITNFNGYVTYSIFHGDFGNNFAIDGDLGLVTIAEPLDREAYSQLNLTLNATDGGGISTNAYLHVTILDVNDVVPSFLRNPYFVELSEDATNGTLVVTLQAVDNDLRNNSVVRYFFYDATADSIDSTNSFSISNMTGEIVLETLLDREDVSSYNLTAVAVDMGVVQLTGTTQVLVTVLDVNEFPPIFTENEFFGSVFENEPQGTFVTQITATDEDFGENATICYSIVEGGVNLFSIHMQTGNLTIDRPLDFEDNTPVYTLVVQATDAGPQETRLESSVNVTVYVLDRNDNPPIFLDIPYTALVLENSLPGSNVLNVSVIDADSGFNAEVNFSLDFLDDESRNNFEIDQLTGTIILSNTSSLDRETTPFYDIIIVATDEGNPPLSDSTMATIFLEDVNDNTPQFLLPYFEGLIGENLPPLTFITNVTASDDDISSNAELTFSITQVVAGRDLCMFVGSVNVTACETLLSIGPNLTDPIFTIDPTTGVISSLQELDREVVSSYVIDVKVQDNSEVQSLSNRVFVLVNVLDVNDEMPSFSQDVYLANISEHAAVGELVIQVMAADMDVSSNADIDFILADSSEFTINMISGEILTLSGDYDRERVSSYELTVLAVDRGTPSLSGSAVVMVTVLDENDSPPVFANATFAASVTENLPPGSFVAQVTATDADESSNANLTYSIISSSPAPHVEIDPSSAILFTTQPLDRELFPFYVLLISARDGGNPSLTGSAQINITVLDENDFPPDFVGLPYQVPVYENVIPQTPLLTVIASDQDLGSNAAIFYYLMDITPAVIGAFEVDMEAGSVSLLRSLDAEESSTYSLTIRADNGDALPNQFSDTSVIVNILDVNDNAPVFGQLDYIVPFLESSPVGSKVVEITASDRDVTNQNSVLRFEIIGGYNTELFNISTARPGVGVVSVAMELDRESQEQHVLEVTVFDSGSPQLNSTTSLTVQLQDANDNEPVFEQSFYEFNLVENSPLSFLVGSVRANDLDQQNVTYSLNSTESFSIDPVTGEIFTADDFDREMQLLYTIFAIATDTGYVLERNSIVMVNVTILDVNDVTPFFTNFTYYIQVMENTSTSTTLFAVEAFDIDDGQNGTFFYSLVPTNDSDFISINTTSGDIILQLSLDRETQNLLEVTVAAADNGDPSLTGTALVVVMVLDNNDNTPVFNSSVYAASIPEDAPTGTEVVSVGASDNDIDHNAELSFSLSDDFSGTFEIGDLDGIIRLTGSLDYEQTVSYSFFVIVQDGGDEPLRSSSSVQIEVVDLNDNSPQFDSDTYQVSIPENAILETPVFQISAMDADSTSNGELRYSILSGNLYSIFAIDEISGIISVADYLDREITAAYSLALRAVDQGTPQFTATAQLDISILDVNDHSPVFDSVTYSVSVSEFAQIGSMIFKFEASDRDVGTNADLTYSIAGGNLGGKFRVGSLSGVLVVGGVLDVKMTPSYALSVRVSDGGSPDPRADTAIIRILVTDFNSFPPAFPLSTYFVNVSQSVPVGTPIGRFIAIDRDSSSRDTLSYRLVNGSSYFTVDAQSGTVYVNRSLVPMEFSLTVEANDGSFVSDVDIRITVVPERLSMETYFFDAPSYYFRVAESAELGDVVGQVGTVGELELNSNLFAIDSAGNVAVSGHLAAAFHVLNVVNMGEPSRGSTYAIVTIEVLDVNDNPPQFESPEYRITISEATPSGTSLAVLQAFDSDSTINNTAITLSLSEDENDMFYFDPVIGVLYTNASLDYEQMSFYNLTVVAVNDLAVPRLSGSAQVFISLVDENDNNPQFSEVLYRLSVPESTLIGTDIFTLDASDPDSGTNSELVFSITHVDQPLTFSINQSNGVISTSAPLSLELGDSYMIYARVADRGNPQPLADSAVVIVDVTRVNDHSPMFSFSGGYDVDVSETLGIGGFVLQVTANDTTSDIFYSIVSGNVGDSFLIDPLTGLISLATPLNFNRQPFYTLGILATDTGVPPLSTNVDANVTVLDENNHVPRFGQRVYNTAVLENVAPGTSVITVTATDEDAVSITYQITRNFKDDSQQNLFTMNSTSGEIMTAGLLDRERAEVIEILVTAVDSGYSIIRSNTLTVVIRVTDINDNAPVFVPFSVRPGVLRLLSANMAVLQVVATDADSIGGNLTYAITADNSSGLFQIDTLSGVIHTTRRVPETTSGYNLNVSAHDGVFTSYFEFFLASINDGDFCEGNGFCTSIREVNCTFDIFPFVECNPFCSRANYALSPARKVCVSYSCLDSALIPCVTVETCLPPSMGCAGVCPQGESLCPTTNLCHVTTLTESCDSTGITCLVGQSLVQRADQSRYCELTDSLPLNGQGCSNDSIYCEQLDTCMELSSPELCQPCPQQLLLCPGGSSCVQDLVQCCDSNQVYCEVLNSCLEAGRRCQLPNVAPSNNLSLLFLGSIRTFSEESAFSGVGHVIHELLGNGTAVLVDSQGEELSLALTEASELSSSLGEWQYSLSNDDSWVEIEASQLSESNALLLPSTTRLRFVQRSVELDGAVWLRVKLWDGNVDGFLSPRSDLVRSFNASYASTIPFTPIKAFSLNTTLLVILLHPLTPPPTFLPLGPQWNLTSIQEDVPVGENLGDVLADVISTPYIPDLSILPHDSINGLPDPIYEQQLPTIATQQFFSDVQRANPTRFERQAALQLQQLPGVAVTFDPTVSTQAGAWQVAFTDNPELFLGLASLISPDAAAERAVLLNISARLRFLPNTDFCGSVSILVAPWDGFWNNSVASVFLNTYVVANTSSGNISSPSGLSFYNLGAWERGVVLVECVPDAPNAFKTRIQTSVIPYQIAYLYDHLFTILVNRSIAAIKEEERVLTSYLHLIIQHPVGLKRLSPAINESTFITFSVDKNAVDFETVSSKISARRSSLALLNFEVLDISQDASYGPGPGCQGTSAAYYHGDAVNSLTAASAVDPEQDVLGVAVVGATPTSQGAWQYQLTSGLEMNRSTSESSAMWVNFPPNLSLTNALLLRGVDRIRFLPHPEYFWTNSSTEYPFISVKLWDMSTIEGPLGPLEAINVNTDPLEDSLQSLHRPIGLFSSEIVTIQATRFGCDGVMNSGRVHDACCVCGGDGEGCVGCDGIANSNRLSDSCDVCQGDNTCLGCDLIPFSGTEPGQCETCLSSLGTSSSNFSSNFSFVDCNGECYGSALLDDCDICSGGNTTHTFNSDKDCIGACFGTAVLDSCGDCTGPGTQLSYNENLDCTGVCGGSFREDSCSVCQLPALNGMVRENRDCAGECFGSAEIDSCGVCYGGSTNISEDSIMDACGVCLGDNSTCVGCNGQVGSGRVYDRCGHCGGNNCGCFVLSEVIPNVGPISGGTEVVVNGAGFFLNDTAQLGFQWNSDDPNCGAPQRYPDGMLIPIVCLFVSEDEHLRDPAIVMDQGQVLCRTPASSSPGSFSLQVRVGNEPASSPLEYVYYDHSILEIALLSPLDWPISSRPTVTFAGRNLINSTAAACLVYNSHRCYPSHSQPPPADYVSIPARFGSSGEVSCELPAASFPCQITVRLSFDGQESGIVETNVANSIFTYQYSSPQVTSVYFLSDLSGIIVTFDRQVETNFSATTSDSLSCEDVFGDNTFSKIGGNLSSCFWENSKQESIIVTLATRADIQVGSSLTFRDNVVQTRNQLYSYSITNFTTTVAMKATRPTAVINGPDSVPYCGQITFSGSHSQHPGYSGFEYYWSILVEDSTVQGYAEISNYLNNLDIQTASSITLNSSYFELEEVYTLQLNVINSAGLRSEIESIQLVKNPKPKLEIFILGPSERSLRDDEDLLLQNAVVNPECATSAQLRLEWELIRVIDQRRNITVTEDISEISAGSHLIIIPSSFFMEEAQYDVRATVRDITDIENSDVAVVKVFVQPRGLTVRIHGGNRTVSYQHELTLDARNSSYSSVLEDITFTWSCEVVGSLEACYNSSATGSSIPVPIRLPNSPFLSFPPSLLRTGRSYLFKLRLNQAERTSEGQVVISIVNDSLPIVEVSSHFLNVVSSAELSLFGFVYSSSPLRNVQWDSVQAEGYGEVDLSDSQVLQSQVIYEPSSSASSSFTRPSQVTVQSNITNRVNLILRSNVLDPNLSYMFRLSASNTVGVSSANVTVRANSPPRSPRLSISPTQGGIALDTEFEISISGALGSVSDVPFLYQFGILQTDRPDSVAVQWLSGQQATPSLQTSLPQGDEGRNFTLDVICRVYDRAGGLIDVVSSVTVLPNPALTQDTLLDNTEQLHRDLNDTKEWGSVLSNLVAYLLETNERPYSENVTLKESIINTFLDIFDTYLPRSSTHLSLASSFFSTATAGTSVLDPFQRNRISQKLTLIAKWFQNESSLVPSFPSIPTLDTGEPLFLQSSYLSPEREVFSNQDAAILLSSWTHLLESSRAEGQSSEMEGQIRVDFLNGVETVGNVLCQQLSTGESSASVDLSSVSLNTLTTQPVGSFNISRHLVEFNPFVMELYQSQVCGERRGVACPEACLVGLVFPQDHAISLGKEIRLTKSSRDQIGEEIEGSDPLKLELVSNIFSVYVSIPFQESYLVVQNLSEPIQIVIPVGNSSSHNGSILLCLYREVGGGNGFQDLDWILDNTTAPDIIEIDSVQYYSCLFHHLSEFAIGILPPPVITDPPTATKPVTMSTVAQTTATTFVIPRQTSAPPINTEPARTSPAGGIAGGIIVALLLTAVVVAVIVIILIWKKRKRKTLKVAPSNEDMPDMAKPSMSGPLTPAESKVPMDIIQCLEEGKRTRLGKMSILPSIRLRELRYEVVESFLQLKNKPFYFLTRQLSDIDPTTEQQQFVSIVFGDKPIFIREVVTENLQTRKHFCVCGNAAQFECSKCYSQGYCSPECQKTHWNQKHERECSRLSEKKRRTDVLKRQSSANFTLPLSPIGEHPHRASMGIQSPTFPPATSPADWKSFMQQKSVTSPAEMLAMPGTAAARTRTLSVPAMPQNATTLGGLSRNMSMSRVQPLPSTQPAQSITAQPNMLSTPLPGYGLSPGAQPSPAHLQSTPLPGYGLSPGLASQNYPISRSSGVVGAVPLPRPINAIPLRPLGPLMSPRQSIRTQAPPLHSTPLKSFAPADIRGEPLLESEEHEYQSTDDSSSDEEKVSKVSSPTSRPPSLATRKKQQRKSSSSESLSSSSSDSQKGTE